MRLHTVRQAIPFALLTFLACFSPAASEPGPLSFEDRVKAQEAIERAYYAHRIWPKENPAPKPPFEEMVPRAAIEAKVKDYLKKCNALDHYWQRPIQPQQLQAEMDRMAKGTKDPAMLRELFAALGNDPYLIAECLARPVLADRLIRNWYAYAPRFHEEMGRRAEEEASACVGPAGMKDLSGEYGETTYLRSAGTSAADLKIEDDPSSIRLDDEEWAALVRRLQGSGTDGQASQDFRSLVPGQILPLRETEEGFILEAVLDAPENRILCAHVIWRKIPFGAWWEYEQDALSPDPLAEAFLEGAEGEVPYSSLPRIEDACADGTWQSGGLPSERSGHTAVWTGTEMIVWGGVFQTTGGRYSPSTDTWTAMSTVGAPTGRTYNTAVWTGSAMIIWGGGIGTAYVNTGGRYNPSTDVWTSTSTSGAPTARGYHTAVWTGTMMIVWGGVGTGYLNTGGRYTPSSDSWSATTTSGAPVGRYSHTAVWADSKMIVWGGANPGVQNTGGLYDPAANTWSATNTSGAPSARYGHTAVWSGTEMLIWGGYNGGYLSTGSRYNPSTNTWVAMAATGAPSARSNHTSVWTGTQMIVWGGYATSSSLNTGGRYDPVGNSWTATPTTGAPTARSYHTAVWTSTEMIVWGGSTSAGSVNDGGRYNPSLGTWAPTGMDGTPAARWKHSAIWTGTEMIVWGGRNQAGLPLGTGARYDPSLDAWTPTSSSGSPTARYAHAAVWTGTQMLVWGGVGSFYDQAGGRYAPSTDSWAAMTTTGAPSARQNPLSVWTGSEMIVWGGYDGASVGTGGRYNPSSNSWVATSMTGAPTPRGSSTAVWTSSLMVIWGGYGNGSLNTGARYDPLLDSWAATSTSCAPSARGLHTAVWTGSAMIIWGGQDSGYINSGGIYDPVADSWAATPLTNPPPARTAHTAVWTGSEMIIWGGYGPGVLNTGARYNACMDAWTATSLAGTPSPRDSHTAVWTSAKMIVWGGAPLTNSTGIYCAAVATAGVPLASPSQSSVDGEPCGSLPLVGHSPVLAWTDVADESGYAWEVWSGAGCTGTLMASGATAAGITSATVSPAIQGGAFTWRVRAVGDGATYCSSDWTCGCAFTIPCYLLSEPSLLQVNAYSCSGGITVTDPTPYLTWSNVANESSYAWEVWDGPGCTGTLVRSGTALANYPTAYVSPPLTDGTYFWRVIAQGNGVAYCDSPWVCGCSFTVDCPEVAAPTQLSVNGQACGGTISVDTPVLDWSNISDEGGYEWEVWSGPGCTGIRLAFDTTAADVTTVTPSIPGGTLSWRVRGLSNGWSTCDGPWTCGCPFTLSCQTMPAPVQLTVDGQTCTAFIQAADDTPILAWQDLNGETGYEWEVFTGVLCTGARIAYGSLGADVTSIDIPSSLPVGTYHWRIRGLGDGTAWCLDGPWVCGCPFTVGSPSCGTTNLTDPVIASDTTWDLAGSPYIVHGTLSVNGGVTLTVDSGVIVKFDMGGSATISGTLALNGTASDLVVLGSLNDSSLCGPSPGGSGTPAPGDWNGVRFAVGSSANLANAYIRHGLEALVIETAEPMACSGVTVQECVTGVITREDSAPVFTNLNLKDASVWIEGRSRPVFSGGIWEGIIGPSSAGHIAYNQPNYGDTPDPVFSGVTIRGFEAFGFRNAVEIWGGSVEGTTHWSGVDFWLNMGTMTLSPTSQVTAFGTTLLMGGSGLDVFGKLDLGAEGATTVVTSDQPAPWPGAWLSIRYWPGSTGLVRDAFFRYGQEALVIETNSPLACSGVTAQDCMTGVITREDSVPVFTNLNLKDAPVWIEGRSQPSFTGGIWEGIIGPSSAGHIAYNMPNNGDTPDPTFTSVTIRGFEAFGFRNAVEIWGGSVEGTTHWSGVDFWLNMGTMTLSPTSQVTAFGTTLLMGGSGLDVFGKLDLGAEGATTVVTSDQPAPWPGAWLSIRYWPGSTGLVRDAFFRYGQEALVIETNSPLACSGVTAQDCMTGVITREDSAPVFTNLNLKDAPVWIEGRSQPSFAGGIWEGIIGPSSAGHIAYNMPNYGDTPDPTFTSVTIRGFEAFGFRNAVEIWGGSVEGTTHWSGVDFWLNTGTMTLSPTSQVTASGTTLLMGGGGLDVFGRLDLGAEGATTVVTSDQPAPWPGSWMSVHYWPGSTGSVRDAFLRYGQEALVIETNSPMTCTGVTVQDSGTGVIIREDSAPVFTNLNLKDASIQIEGRSHPTISSGVWELIAGASIPGAISYNTPNFGDTPDPIFSGITIRGFEVTAAENGMHLLGGPIQGSTHWTGVDFWFVSGFVSIDPTGHVTVSNTNLLMSSGASIEVSGRLDIGADGTTTRVVADWWSGGPGSWNSIEYQPGSMGTVRNATIQDGWIALAFDTDESCQVTGSTITGNTTGLSVTGSSSPKIERTIFTSNDIAIQVQDSAAPDLGGGAQGSDGLNTLIGTTWSVQNLSTNPISAQYNWWGCPTTAEMDAGSADITLIYDFADDSGAGVVDYANWLGGKNRTITAHAGTEEGARDVVLLWMQEPTGTLSILRGTDPQVMIQVDTSSGFSWRDIGALDSPDLLFYRVDGPCP